MSPGNRTGARCQLAGGHLMAQLAACRDGVGLVALPATRLVEVRGSSADVHAMARTVAGRPVPRGEGVRIDGGWWQATSSHRALILADTITLEQFEARVAAVARGHDLWVGDVSGGHVTYVLAGRRSAQLAHALQDVGALVAMLVVDGDGHLVVIRADDPREAHRVVLARGRRHGALEVDLRAVELLRAAARSRSVHAAGTSSQLQSSERGS